MRLPEARDRTSATAELLPTQTTMPVENARAFLRGCSSVASIAINRATDGHTESNWSLCVVSAGAADANTAARAALTVRHALRRDYDLMTD
jgi:hypothetical protein